MIVIGLIFDEFLDLDLWSWILVVLISVDDCLYSVGFIVVRTVEIIQAGLCSEEYDFSI